MKKCAFLGIPISLGSANTDLIQGPQALRDNGVIEKLTQAGLNIVDAGDTECSVREGLSPGNTLIRYEEPLRKEISQAASRCAELISQGNTLVSIGGDHSFSMATMNGARQSLPGSIGLVWIDAHGDLNTAETSLTGNAHGMSLAEILGLGGMKQCVAPEDLFHIGGKDFDQGELDIIEKENLKCVFLKDMLADGLRPVFDGITMLSRRVDHVWVSLDLDGLDERWVPGVAMPNHGGITYREIKAIAQHIGGLPNVVGIDIAEHTPATDIEGKTSELMIELIANFLGKDYSFYTNYLKRNQK